MAQRPRLSSLAHNPKPAQIEPQAAPAPELDEEQPMLPIKAPKVQRSRQGKKAVTVYVSAEMARTIKILAAKNDRQIEDMAREALNDLLRKYGEHPQAA